MTTTIDYTPPPLIYRPSYVGSHWRVMRVRDGVEHLLAAVFPDVKAALRAVDRLYDSHGLETPEEQRTADDEEDYWRRIALVDWDGEE